jgi:hypothetical protein
MAYTLDRVHAVPHRRVRNLGIRFDGVFVRGNSRRVPASPTGGQR